jgi:cytochrome c-type biogenesis protein CcmH/NrfF
MRRALVAALVTALAAAPGALAADCPQTSLADIEDEVMCPACGVPLELATDAPQAKRERELIVRLVDDCKSKGEIKDALKAEFGNSVTAVPDDEGFDLAAYLVPLLALLGGGAAVALAWARWRRSRRPGGDGPERPPADDAARLEADLERYEL